MRWRKRRGAAARTQTAAPPVCPSFNESRGDGGLDAALVGSPLDLEEALVAPREGLRKVLGFHRLMGRSRQRVVAAPHNAGGLGGLAVPHRVVARRKVEWGSKQQGREVELHNREDASRGVSLFHWGSCKKAMGVQS